LPLIQRELDSLLAERISLRAIQGLSPFREIA
jgi:hypothetical protein